MRSEEFFMITRNLLVSYTYALPCRRSLANVLIKDQRFRGFPEDKQRIRRG